LLCQWHSENAPSVNSTERNLEKHSRDRDYPTIIRAHSLIILELSTAPLLVSHRESLCRYANARRPIPAVCESATRRTKGLKTPIICAHKSLLGQRHDHAAILGNRIVGCPIDAQVCHDRFRGSMSQPFRERKVLKTIDLAEHLQEH
jgi:hypothetical protein